MTRSPRNFARSLALAVLSVAVAAAQTAPAAGQIAERVTPNALKADVSFLASDALQGRGTPSPGQEIAAEYIAAQFRRAGLEPVGDDGYFQTAPYVSLEPKTEGLELTLDIGGTRYAVDRASMSLLSPAPARLDGVPALRLTSPGAMAALTPDQKRGKVLLAEGGIPLRSATADNPALVILVASEQARMARSMFSLRPASDPAPGVPIALVWDPAVRKALKESKNARILVTARIPDPAVTPVKLRNVVGVLRGSDPSLKDTYVLLTSHYDHLGVRGTGEGDHIYNGANDDASGTASIVEAANALGSLGARPKRSIVFVALFGEELGLLGSRYYAKHPVFPLARTVADLNVEQVGRTDVDDGLHKGELNATGFDFTNLTAVLQRAGQESGIRVLNDKKNSDAYFARSDNQAFADAGIPSHTLSVGYTFPEYHGPADEWPKLDYDNMARVVRTIALAVYRIADDSEAPRWNTANPKTARYVHARDVRPEGVRTQ
jgi:hypothetical protein